jgi:2-polyprenyl-3-methyl-5-hydroxy-6-metoxy-1,4-benzoquinol methylase
MTQTLPQRVEDALCPICRTDRWSTAMFESSDRMFGIEGRFPTAWCFKCQVLYLKRRPTEYCISGFYPERVYYSHLPSMAVASRPLRNWIRSKLVDSRSKAGRSSHLLLRLLDWARGGPGYYLDSGWRIISMFPKGSQILDIGCGNGDALAFYQRFGWECYGVELSKAAVDVAVNRGLDVKHSQHLWEANYLSESFDIIRINHVLEHLYDPVRTLAEVWRVLKPTGRVLVATPNISGIHARIFGQYWYQLDSPRHIALYSIYALKMLMAMTGLRIQSMSTMSNSANILLSLYTMMDTRQAKHRFLLSQWAPNHFWKTLGLLLWGPTRVVDLLGYGDNIVVELAKTHYRTGLASA